MLNVCLSLNENNCQTALWFWTQHNPHGGGLVWLLDQVTWNLPDLSRVRKANGSLQPEVPAALHMVLENTEDLIEDINHLDLLTRRTLRNNSKMIRNRLTSKYNRELGGCSRGNMAAIPWRHGGHELP